jgi:excinuclease ABC subunit A
MSKYLEIIGAKKHNLKNVSVSIPKNKLTVVTGVSGSGKSSLAFDTLYAEGQRRYLESLSTYARMIIAGGHEETMVDEIRGLSPTISINQKTVSSNPRSTVGTITEIYDFYRLLFLHIGFQLCPTHGILLQKNTVGEVFEMIKKLPKEERYIICAPLIFPKGKKEISVADIKQAVVNLGFIRYMLGDDIYALTDEVDKKITTTGEIFVVIDRLVSDGVPDENTTKRIKDSLELAYKTGDEFLLIHFPDTKKSERFSRQAVCPKCHYRSQDLTLSHFSFNSHLGACEQCHGLGIEVAFLEENIINENLSISEGAILPWNQGGYYLDILTVVAKKYKIDLNKPFNKLSAEHRQHILYGANESFEIDYVFENGNTKKFKTRFEGIVPFLQRKYKESDVNDSITKRIAHYITEIECPTCSGYRLKEAPLNVFLADQNIGQVADKSVREALDFFAGLDLTKKQATIGKNVLSNIRERLQFLSDV